MHNTQEFTTTDRTPTKDWVHGDGGPLVYLRSGALNSWMGASDFDNSILSGGTVRTGYVVICELEDGVNVITYHGRDMIVMSDVEWASRLVERHDCLFIFQSMGRDGTPEAIIETAISEPPASALRFSQIESTGMLTVGANAGIDLMYDWAEIAIEPGDYTVTAFIRQDAYIARLTKREQDAAEQPAIAGGSK